MTYGVSSLGDRPSHPSRHAARLQAIRQRRASARRDAPFSPMRFTSQGRAGWPRSPQKCRHSAVNTAVTAISLLSSRERRCWASASFTRWLYLRQTHISTAAAHVTIPMLLMAGKIGRRLAGHKPARRCRRCATCSTTSPYICGGWRPSMATPTPTRMRRYGYYFCHFRCCVFMDRLVSSLLSIIHAGKGSQAALPPSMSPRAVMLGALVHADGIIAWRIGRYTGHTLHDFAIYLHFDMPARLLPEPSRPHFAASIFD